MKIKKNKSWLECINIDYIIDDKQILDNINLKFEEGEVITILGPNGSGKSSLIKLISRSIYPRVKRDSTLLIYEKKNVNIWKMRSRIGFVNNEINERIKYRVTLGEVLISGLYGSIGLPMNHKITEGDWRLCYQLLEKFCLLDQANTNYLDLSDGQKRIALIARALINNPRVVVLDEPTINLDIKSYNLLLNLLTDLSKEGISLLVATNNVESIIKETTRIVLIKKGKVIADGIPDKIMNSKNLSFLYDTELKVVNIEGYWKIIPSSSIKI